MEDFIWEGSQETSGSGGGNERYVISRTNEKADAVEKGIKHHNCDKITNGNKVTFWIRCNYKGVGTSDWVKAEVTPVSPAENPTLMYIKSGDGSVYAIWVASGNANEYQTVVLAAESKSPNEDSTLIKNDNTQESSTTYAFFNGLENGKTYSVYIRAKNSNGYAAQWVKVGDATPVAASQSPNKPQNVSVKQNPKNLSITWDLSPDASEYLVACSKKGAEATPISIKPKSNPVKATIANLENGATYDCSVRAKNSFGESDPTTKQDILIQQTASSVNFNGSEDTVIGKATAEYKFSVDVPHSDFARVTKDAQDGGRTASDRITRVMETEIGNLFADGVSWYVTDMLGKDIDFAYLMGSSIDAAIPAGDLTPKSIIKAMNSNVTNGVNDTIVLVDLPGKYIASSEDYGIDISYTTAEDGTVTDHYPYDFINKYPTTLLGQTAACLRKAHPGGMASPTGLATGIAQCDIWGNPSSTLRYEIEYLPYDYQAFRDKFIKNVSKEQLTDARAQTRAQSTSAEYAAKDGYLLPADKMSGIGAGNSLMFKAQGYQRGKVKDTVKINGQPINQDKTYRIATTQATINKYNALVDNGIFVEDTGILVWNAVANYVYSKQTVTPEIDGRVNIIGGIPFTTNLSNPVDDPKYK